MSAGIDRLLERIRQNTAARMAALGADRQRTTPGVTRIDRAVAPGARVFDPISGQEGEVIDARSENVVVPTTKR